MKSKGMLMALMEEYRKASYEYCEILNQLSNDDFNRLMDSTTTDPDCKSIQSVTSHVIGSGYGYANYIQLLNKKDEATYNGKIESPQKGIEGIKQMLDFTENVLNNIADKTTKEIAQWKFHTSWDVTYDFEQLMEHAIVHVLRHRRQVENFLKKTIHAMP